MAAPSYKLNIPKGEDSTLAMIWKGSNREPVDLTGFSFEAELYSDQSTVFRTLTLGNGGILVDAASGKIQLNFADDLSDGIRLTAYAQYKVWMTTPDLQRKLFLKGNLSFYDQ